MPVHAIEKKKIPTSTVNKPIINSNNKYIENVDLEPCPFCGQQARAERTYLYCVAAYRVLCPNCHCGTYPVAEGEYMLGKTLTHEQALQEAVDKWNMRSAIAHNPPRTRDNSLGRNS